MPFSDCQRPEEVNLSSVSPKQIKFNHFATPEIYFPKAQGCIIKMTPVTSPDREDLF